MKANINPGIWPVKPGMKMLKSEVAACYGLTLDEYMRHDMDFLQSEGYHNDGHESDDLHDWLTYNPKRYRDNTPYQKGDDQP